MRDSRKEGSAAVRRGPVLEPHAEVVPADEALEAGAQERAPVVLAQLDALVHRPVAVAQVRRERVPKVDAETLLRAGSGKERERERADKSQVARLVRCL